MFPRARHRAEPSPWDEIIQVVSATADYPEMCVRQDGWAWSFLGVHVPEALTETAILRLTRALARRAHETHPLIFASGHWLGDTALRMIGTGCPPLTKPVRRRDHTHECLAERLTRIGDACTRAGMDIMPLGSADMAALVHYGLLGVSAVPPEDISVPGRVSALADTAPAFDEHGGALCGSQGCVAPMYAGRLPRRAGGVAPDLWVASQVDVCLRLAVVPQARAWGALGRARNPEGRAAPRLTDVQQDVARDLFQRVDAGEPVYRAQLTLGVHGDDRDALRRRICDATSHWEALQLAPGAVSAQKSWAEHIPLAGVPATGGHRVMIETILALSPFRAE